ncbi:DnaJ domain-containing protein, partial [Saliphagus infecundisoli]
MESPFDVLRIAPDADDAEIERAYRERVKEAHPDHGGSADE